MFLQLVFQDRKKFILAVPLFLNLRISEPWHIIILVITARERENKNQNLSNYMYKGKTGYYIKIHGSFFILLKIDVKKVFDAGGEEKPLY